MSNFQSTDAVQKINLVKIGFLAILMLCWEGLLPAFLGLPTFIGRYVVAALVLAGIGAWIFFALKRKKAHRGFQRHLLVSVLFFLYCVSVSIYYSQILNNFPAREWLFAQYAVTPLLVGFLLSVLGIRWNHIFAAIVICAVLVTVLSLLDQLLLLPVLDTFARPSINDPLARRVVIMRVEIGAGMMLLFAWLANRRKYGLKSVIVALLLVAMTYTLFRISESRQTIAAVALGGTYFILSGGVKGQRLAYVLFFLIFLVLPLSAYFLLGPYLDKYFGSSDYIDDGNISIRFEALAFYYEKFVETRGVGFGILSNGDNATNFFAFAHRVGNGSWPFYIADIGIFSALVQFGWLGLAIVVITTLKISYTLIVAGRKDSNVNSAPLAMGCYLLAAILHPWPANYLTLEWTALFGGLMWYSSADMLREKKRVFSTRRRIFQTAHPHELSAG